MNMFCASACLYCNKFVSNPFFLLVKYFSSELADVDRYFYGETSNPCISRRDLMEKYISFLERVYPRRCCDADEMVTLGMITDMERPIVHQKDYCNVCQELNICCEKKNTNSNVAFNDNTSSSDAAEVEVISPSPSICEGKKIQNSQSEKRHKRLSRKSPGAKIVSRVIDRALQPTLGILFGKPGNSKFRRELHRLSRDTAVRNCGKFLLAFLMFECVIIVFKSDLFPSHPLKNLPPCF